MNNHKCTYVVAVFVVREFAVYTSLWINAPHNMKCVCPKVRRVGSKAAVLVIVWTYLVYVSCASIVYYGRFANLGVVHIQAVTIGFSISALLGPVVGLVASAFFGRYKVVYASLWFMWSGIFAVSITQVILSFVSDTHIKALIYSGEIAAVAVYFLGVIAFTVNSVPFGLDQMPDASSEQITAFIHWYTWSALAGAATAQLIDAIMSCIAISHTSIILSFNSCFLLTLTLCSIFLLRHWLIIEPESRNPLKTMFKVLQFAAKHKVPVRRSAFTFWEPEIPSRIDLGKSKYGGPFTNEEVEDVKTFLQMLVIILSPSITWCSFALYVSSYSNTLPTMIGYKPTICHHQLLHLMQVLMICMIFSLPVHDVVIRPIITRCVSSTLKRAGLAQILVICISLMVMAVSVVWYITESPDHCLLVSSDGLSPLSMDHEWIMAIINVTAAIFCFVFFTAMLEFVCAQAPYNLRGLLVGTLPSVVLFSTFLGVVVCYTWLQGFKHQESSGSMCGIWFYLFTTITAILGCVIWCVVAKWYKKRERDEPEMYYIFAENYYSQ